MRESTKTKDSINTHCQSREPAARSAMRLIILRRYLLTSALGNLIWEFAQLPLYTIWHQGTRADILFAALHCTGGDVLITVCSLIAALLLAATPEWPLRRYGHVAAVAIGFGLFYTVFSEWLNTEIRKSWSYSDLMPTLPFIGTGLSPLVQWLLVPAGAFWVARYPLIKTESV